MNLENPGRALFPAHLQEMVWILPLFLSTDVQQQQDNNSVCRDMKCLLVELSAEQALIKRQ